MTAAELAEKGIDVYNDRKNWTYVQGALGQLGESDRVRGLYKYFWGQPNHAGNSMTMAYSSFEPLSRALWKKNGSAAYRNIWMKRFIITASLTAA